MTEAQTQQTRYIPIKDWAKYYDYPSPKSWRQIIFRNRFNIVEKVIKRFGGRILIDESAYFKFIAELNQKDGVKNVG